MACLWPCLWRLETKNRGQISGSHGWSSTLECRAQVWVLGRGSISPIATFLKLCRWQTCTSYTPACITLTEYFFFTWSTLIGLNFSKEQVKTAKSAEFDDVHITMSHMRVGHHTRLWSAEDRWKRSIQNQWESKKSHNQENCDLIIFKFANVVPNLWVALHSH